MNNSRASFILKALATGHDPATEKPLSDSDVLAEPDVIRALFLGAYALDERPEIVISEKGDKSHLPAGAGRPWTNDEEQALLEEFNSGKPIRDMSDDHSRTDGAIRARLVKMGLMDERGKDPR